MKKMRKVLAIMLVVVFALTGCGTNSQEKVANVGGDFKLKNSSFVIETNEQISYDVADYVDASEDAMQNLTLDVSQVDTSTVGAYYASVSNGDIECSFVVNVTDNIDTYYNSVLSEVVGDNGGSITSIIITCPGERSLTISWNAVDGASGYKVFMGTSAGSLSQNQIIYGAENTTTTYGFLDKQTEYFFQVCPYFESDGQMVNGDFSSVVSQVPTNEANTVVTPLSTPIETEEEIPEEVVEEVTEVPVEVTEETTEEVTEAPVETTTEEVSTPSIDYNAPISLSLASNEKHKITLSWNAVDGASGYKVFMGTSADTLSQNQVLGLETTTTYGYLEDKEYFFQVCPYFENDGETIIGAYSNIASIVPKTNKKTKVETQPTTEEVTEAPVETTTEVPTEITTETTTETPTNVNNGGSGANTTPQTEVQEEVVKPNEEKLVLSANGKKNSVTLKWNAISNASGYRICLGSKGGNVEQIALQDASEDTSITISYLPEKEFDAKVIAYTQDGGVKTNIAESNIATFNLTKKIVASNPQTATTNTTTPTNKTNNVATQPATQNTNTTPKKETTTEAAKQESVVESTTDTVNNVFTQINEVRSGVGQSELKSSAVLSVIAQNRANHMVQNNYFSHYYNGQSQVVYWRDYYGYSKDLIIGENIAKVYPGENTSKTTVDAWVNSPGHYSNIVDSDYVATGIGVAKYSDGTYVVVQVFSSGTK